MFLDERGAPIPGNWPGSPKPTEHDVLTGSTAQGIVAAGLTCNDWSSDSPDLRARIGHADGIGRGGNTSGSSAVWNSSHDNGSCAEPRRAVGRGEFTASPPIEPRFPHTEG